MVNEAQKKDIDTRSVQVESTAERARRTTRAQCPLLGHIRPSSYVANRPHFPHPFDPAWMAKPTTRLRHGLSTGPSGDDSLLEAPAGVPTQRDHEKNSRAQVTTQRIRPKTSRARLE